jgi:hypothetical protein
VPTAIELTRNSAERKTSRGDKLMCPIQTTTNLDAPFLYNVNAEEEHYGDRAQRNYDFLERLWHPVTGAGFRNDLIGLAQASQVGLKADPNVVALGLGLAPDVYVALLDLESGRMVYDNAPPAHPDGFYILMLPATPRARPGSRSYKVAQQWAEAWYHAVRETGGM